VSNFVSSLAADCIGGRRVVQELGHGYRVAVVGATGNVGREMLSIMAEREFPADEVVALASLAFDRQGGLVREDDVLKVQDLETFDFRASTSCSRRPARRFPPFTRRVPPRPAPSSSNNTSQFRMTPTCHWSCRRSIRRPSPDSPSAASIANPNCSTMQMVVALKPLHDLARIKAGGGRHVPVGVGGGPRGDDELFNQTRAIYVMTR